MAIWSFTPNLIKINIFKILPPKPLGKKEAGVCMETL